MTSHSESKEGLSLPASAVVGARVIIISSRLQGPTALFGGGSAATRVCKELRLAPARRPVTPQAAPPRDQPQPCRLRQARGHGAEASPGRGQCGPSQLAWGFSRRRFVTPPRAAAAVRDAGTSAATAVRGLEASLAAAAVRKARTTAAVAAAVRGAGASTAAAAVRGAGTSTAAAAVRGVEASLAAAAVRKARTSAAVAAAVRGAGASTAAAAVRGAGASISCLRCGAKPTRRTWSPTVLP